MRKAVWVVACAFLGCSESPPCGEFVGTYEVHYRERPGGTCGDLGPTIAVYDEDSVVGGPAMGDDLDCERDTYDDGDACTLDVAMTCTPEGGFPFTFDGRIVQTDGINFAEGVVELVDTDPEFRCQSLYDVTFDRL